MKAYIFIFLGILFLACSPKLNLQYQRTGLVTCETHDKMTITLISEGQAENMGKSASFAERNAIENLLFKGIPKSNQEKPMINNESKVRRDNQAFYMNFIENRGFQLYITSSTVNDHYVSGGVHVVKQRIEIDLTNLRKHLVTNKIVRGFGL